MLINEHVLKNYVFVEVYILASIALTLDSDEWCYLMNTF